MQTAPERARRGIVYWAALLGVIRTLRFVEQRSEWKRMHHEPTNSSNARMSGACSSRRRMRWGPDALAQRAITAAIGYRVAELSMVVGPLAWLVWDVEPTST